MHDVLFDEDGNVIEEENEERMQKYFVAFSFDTPREGQSPLTGWSWCFSKTLDIALTRAKDKLEKIHKDKKDRRVDKVWVAEFTNLQDPLRQIVGTPPPASTLAIIASILDNARKSYNVRQKGKPRIKLKSSDIPPWEVAAARSTATAANKTSPQKPLYIPYLIVSGGENLQSHQT